jgi:serine/threonine-protein kinase
MATDQEQIQRFIREARVTAKIKDDHVVRVLDVGATESGLPFIAMELLAGEDLGQISARERVPLPLAVDYVLQASVGLLHAHAAGIVHRDVKPSNLWLTRRGDGSPLIKVLDFGISKLAEAHEGEKRLTETSSSFGSPSYMSPEQVRSAKRVDSRSDAWSMGVVLFELLTQALPFDADNVSGVLAAIIADPPLRLSELMPGAPAQVESLLVRLLQKVPGERATLQEAAHTLRPFATPAGQQTADYILGTFGAGMPPPAPSASMLPQALPSAENKAFSETLHNTSTTTRVARRRTRVLGSVAGVSLGVGAILLSVVLLGKSRIFPVPVPSASPLLPATPSTPEPATPSTSAQVPTSSSSSSPAAVPSPSPAASAVPSAAVVARPTQHVRQSGVAPSAAPSTGPSIPTPPTADPAPTVSAPKTAPTSTSRL